MTDILLRDIDPALIERLNRVAAANGWPSDESLRNVFEHGLHALELAATLRLNEREENALQSLRIAGAQSHPRLRPGQRRKPTAQRRRAAQGAACRRRSNTHNR